MYVRQEDKDKFGSALEQFLVQKKSEDAKKEVENVCFYFMNKYPLCVCEPIVNIYKVLRE